METSIEDDAVSDVDMLREREISSLDDLERLTVEVRLFDFEKDCVLDAWERLSSLDGEPLGVNVKLQALTLRSSDRDTVLVRVGDGEGETD
jgi:hypothetical protein